MEKWLDCTEKGKDPTKIITVRGGWGSRGCVELFQYQQIAYVTVPTEVPISENRVETWLVQHHNPTFTDPLHHAAFFGDPWMMASLYEVPTVVEWWNKTLDLMPVLDDNQLVQESLIWLPETYVADVPDMDSWFNMTSQPTLPIPQTDGFFTLEMPRDVTFTEELQPYRLPRSDDEDELRFRTH